MKNLFWSFAIKKTKQETKNNKKQPKITKKTHQNKTKKNSKKPTKKIKNTQKENQTEWPSKTLESLKHCTWQAFNWKTWTGTNLLQKALNTSATVRFGNMETSQKGKQNRTCMESRLTPWALLQTKTWQCSGKKSTTRNAAPGLGSFPTAFGKHLSSKLRALADL